MMFVSPKRRAFLTLRHFHIQYIKDVSWSSGPTDNPCDHPCWAPRSESKITNKWLEAGAWQIGDKGEKHAATLHLKAGES